MAWLPFEDKIAGMSEELVLKYNPTERQGRNNTPIHIPQCYDAYFDNVYSENILSMCISHERTEWQNEPAGA
ncbi:MAG: hypothetical protein ACLS48_04825 [[Eubacterium] siraeum]